MKAINIPVKFPQAFAAQAGGTFIRAIPNLSQIGIQDGAASLTTGFPPLTFLPVSAGGVPPFGQDMNGILNQATAWDLWFSVGGAVAWDAAQSAAIGGYPLGALVASLTFGEYWLNQADDNTTNPDTGGANWVRVALSGTPTTGDAQLTMKTTAAVGWVLMNDGSIGNAASNATARANADTAALFSLIWTNVSNTYAVLQTSAGAPTARGVSAAADFAANRRLVLPLVLGRAIIIAGAGAGLTSRALGQNLGEETHLQTLAEIAAHTHGISPTALQNGGTNLQGSSALGFYGSLGATATQSAGSSTPFNVMQPSSAWNIQIKL